MGPLRRTPTKLPTKKMVWAYLGISLRSQTRSHRLIAVFWSARVFETSVDYGKLVKN